MNLCQSQEACQQLKLDYDGYHFTYDTPGMYNPFSILNTLSKQRYGSYWFETGIPTFLVELLQKADYNLEEISNMGADSAMLNNLYGNSPFVSYAFKFGLLTIKGYDKRFGIYELGFPNREVEDNVKRLSGWVIG